MDDQSKTCNTFHCKSLGRTILQYHSKKPISCYPKQTYNTLFSHEEEITISSTSHLPSNRVVTSFR